MADNVWEPEVISELLKTGMWILVTTRDRAVLECSVNVSAEIVEVNEMFDDATLVFTRAAELSDNVPLPEAAMKGIELCGSMAMDLAFVGSWDMVRGRKDPRAWQDVVDAITSEMQKLNVADSTVNLRNAIQVRREAILRAGYRQLDHRHRTLYMSLVVLPYGHAFTVDSAAVLLHDRECVDEDKAAVKQVVENLDRWSVVESCDDLFKMHDAHATISKKMLENNEDVRSNALRRWTKFISTLSALRSFDVNVMVELCSAVERAGGVVTDISREYMAELQDMEVSNPNLYRSLLDVGFFF